MQILLLLLTIIHFWTTSAQDIPSCSSPIYCQGKLLDTIQLAAIFNDSKTFVDLKQKNTTNETLASFEKFLEQTNNQPTRQEVKEFVDENFEEADEFESWVPPDFKPNPKFLDNIEDEEVKKFAQNLVNLWQMLAKKIKEDVINNSELYSLIPVENGFIIPGGRFKEFYYWDSYWIIKGLLISEMYDTARGMLDNFLSLIQRYGFIPNGARIYYLNRSQPPLLTLMVAEYIKAKPDRAWLKQNIGFLDQELKYWLKNHTVDIQKSGTIYTLARYDSESGTPRPESYLQDVQTAQFLENEEDKKSLYADLKSGAESGWDFSSRWIFDSNGGNTGNISQLQTRRVIPVDLNAFLYTAFKDLSYLYLTLGDLGNAIFWLEKAAIWRKTIQQVLYNETDGIWYDYDIELGQQRRIYYASNFAPLWAESYNIFDGVRVGSSAAEYFRANNLTDFMGGIPTSLEHSGEQWDFPNAWAPLQAIIILGLDNTGDQDAKKIAEEFAKRWVNANMIGYKNSGEMFEKYDAVRAGEYGGGGEYKVQSGFGWTNGVALELIARYFSK